MVAEIITTVGAADANSFGSVAEADDYISTIPGADDWHALDAVQKRRFLIDAARDICRENLRGCRATSTQALAFPRVDVEKPDSAWGECYAADEIPQLVKEAQFERALYRLRNRARSASGQRAIASYSGSGRSVTYDLSRTPLEGECLEYDALMAPFRTAVTQLVRG